MDKYTQEAFVDLDNQRYELNYLREEIGAYLYSKKPELNSGNFEKDLEIANKLLHIQKELLNHYEEYDLDTIENVKDLIENHNIQNYVLLLDSAIERIDKEIENL